MKPKSNNKQAFLQKRQFCQYNRQIIENNPINLKNKAEKRLENHRQHVSKSVYIPDF